MKKKIKFWSTKEIALWVRVIIAVLVALFYFVCAYFNSFIKTLNNNLTDRVYQTGTGFQLPVVIIGIDDKTLNEMEQPATWSRDAYAAMLENLSDESNKPYVVGFDTLFTGTKQMYEGDNGDAAFASAAEKNGHVVVGVNVSFDRDKVLENDNGEKDIADFYAVGTQYPYEELRKVVKFGEVNPPSGSDGYIRQLFTYVNDENGEQIDSFALAVLKEYAEAEGIALPDYNSRDENLYRFSFSTDAQNGITEFSFCDVCSGKIDPAYFDRSIVLVGAYASGLMDDFRIPGSMWTGKNMYGVEIHANMLMALLQEDIQTRPENMLVYSLIMAAIVGAIAFFLMKVAMGFEVALSFVISVAYFGYCYFMYDVFKKNYDIFYFILAMIIVDIGYIVFHYLSEYLSKMKINRVFRMYVAPEIVDEVSKNKSYELQLGGRNKDIAVLFVDIRGFTTMSESLKPDEVVEILNEYFDVITTAVFDNKGTLDKFIGDAAMAVFNSPFDLDDYVFRAVNAAQDIAKGSVKLAERLQERFGRTVSYGIGVNCGEATIGNIGSKFRMEYTAIGDTVNTASRLESNAGAGEILISNEVKERLKDRITTEPVGEIPLKGKKIGIFVHRVIDVNVDKV